MPNIKSAVKRVKVSETKKMQNKTKKSELRTCVKKCKESITNTPENAQDALTLAFKKIDKAASKNLIHKNAAARKKSQLAKAFNASKVAE